MIKDLTRYLDKLGVVLSSAEGVIYQVRGSKLFRGDDHTQHNSTNI